jgi:hypothetical protein
MASAAEIIKRLHDSEINGAIDWFFDSVCIGDTMNGWKLEGKGDTFEEAVRDLADNAVKAFPNSTFAGWWVGPRNGYGTISATSPGILRCSTCNASDADAKGVIALTSCSPDSEQKARYSRFKKR